MQFVTLCVTQRLCDFRLIEVRLKSPFRPSATYFDGAKVGKAPSSVSGPTSSGSFALSLIRGSPQRAIHGPMRLAWRPARLPPDQRQDSAVTYVALCVVSAIAVEKHFRALTTHNQQHGCDAERHERHANAEHWHDSRGVFIVRNHFLADLATSSLRRWQVTSSRSW